MIENKQVQRIKNVYFKKIQIRYIPLSRADLTGFKAIEKDVIDNDIAQMGEWTTMTIKEYTHSDKPCKASETNHNIDYEYAFYLRTPHSLRKYDEDDQSEI